MKKLAAIGLLLCMGNSYASDKYEQAPKEAEARGKTVEAASAVGGVVVDIATFIFQVPKSIYEGIRDNASGNDNYMEVDVRNGDGGVEKKSLRLSAEAFAAGSIGSGNEGALPVKITVSAEHGEGITIEEAKIGAFRMVSEEYGITFDYFTFGHVKPIQYTSKDVSEYNYVDLVEISYNDILWSSNKRKVDIVLGGKFTGGAMQNLKSYGKDTELSGGVYNYNASGGVRVNSVFNTGTVVVEGYSKNTNFQDGGKMSRNGFQVVFKDSKSRFSISAGVAKEKSNVFSSIENDEVYIKGKYYFK
jgi:hypothetical protein